MNFRRRIAVVKVNKRRCERCGELKNDSECYERRFIYSFNEVLCDACVASLIEKGQIVEKKDADGNTVYQQNLEHIYKRIVELEEENEQLNEQIFQNRKMLKRLEKIRDFVEMNISSRDQFLWECPLTLSALCLLNRVRFFLPLFF